MISVKQLLELLLELDQQVISPRPSTWGEAAQLVATLARHAEERWESPTCTWVTQKPVWLRGWRDVNLSTVNDHAADNLFQPVLDELTSSHVHLDQSHLG